MALPQAWKFIYAEGNDTPVARRLFQVIQGKYTGEGIRAPVQQWIVDMDEDVFMAVTNCGWARLDLEAWKIGHPGTRRYISSSEEWDEEARESLLNSRP